MGFRVSVGEYMDVNYASVIYESGAGEERTIISPELTMIENEPGTFTFSIANTNTNYNSVISGNIVYIYDMDDFAYIWIGIIRRTEVSFNLVKSVICEGMLSILKNFTLPEDFKSESPYFSGDSSFTTTNLIKTIIYYMQEVSSRINLHLYEYMNDRGIYVPWIKQGETMYDLLLRTLAYDTSSRPRFYIGYGYVNGYNSDATRGMFLNYTDTQYSYTSNNIEYGKNLLDIKIVESIENYYSHILAYGKTDQFGGKVEMPGGFAQTIKPMYFGLNTPYQNLLYFGRHLLIKDFSDAEDSEELEEECEDYIAANPQKTKSFEITALDLSYVDSNIARYHLSDIVYVTSEPHGIFNEEAVIKEIKIPLQEPWKTTVKINSPNNRLTSLI